MSYSVYSTRGFIVGSAPSGEAGKTYFLYTEHFGLIRAHAQGVRHIKSKLRYNLVDYSFKTFSLVRGKEFWRITGVASENEVAFGNMGEGRSILAHSDISSVRARILNFIKRLVQGEERNDELFAILLELFSANTSTFSTQQDFIGFETKILARLLSSLGYIDLTTINGMSQKDMIFAINKALKESHL